MDRPLDAARRAIDRGATRDKVPARDPAAAPLEGDAEAAAAPTPGAALRVAAAAPGRDAPDALPSERTRHLGPEAYAPPSVHRAPPATTVWGLGLALLLLAVLGIALGIWGLG